MEEKAPHILDFLDPVDFLNSYYQWRKSKDSKFSYARWQEELGVGSKTLLRFILTRRRQISRRTAIVLKVHLRLSPEQAQYFDLLISYVSAKSSSERRSLSESLLKLQRGGYQPVFLSPEASANDVLQPVVVAMMTYRDIQFTPKLLADLLGTEVSRIQSILKPLVEKGIILINQRGHYEFQSADFEIGDSLGDVNLKAYYLHWLEQAKLALDWPAEIRRYRAIKFAASPAEFLEVQKQMAEFAIQILSTYRSKSMIGRRLYMLESALFPLSRMLEASEKA